MKGTESVGEDIAKIRGSRVASDSGTSSGRNDEKIPKTKLVPAWVPNEIRTQRGGLEQGRVKGKVRVGRVLDQIYSLRVGTSLPRK
jgi:hypothetical protein